jgi:hypothetical protein
LSSRPVFALEHNTVHLNQITFFVRGTGNKGFRTFIGITGDFRVRDVGVGRLNGLGRFTEKIEIEALWEIRQERGMRVS